MPAEDFRRWFGETTYASDSGDQIVVWVPSEAVRRYIEQHFDDDIDETLRSLGREETHVRFIVGGTDDDEDELE